jgi:ribosomal protein L11 methyltransferase
VARVRDDSKLTPTDGSKWLELSCVVEPEAVDAVAEVFGRFGRGVAIDQPVMDAPDWDGGWVDPTKNVVVKTYLPADTDAARVSRLLEEAVWHLGRLRHVEPLQIRELGESDWAHAWKRFFFPHRVGRRLVIVPSWRRRARQPDDLIIRLDPGMAFGTGLHPTTRMCLALLEDEMFAAANVFDFGCGSGILSVAAVRLGAASVEAVDIDEVAARVARENALRNRVARRISVHHGNLGTDWWPRRAPFDVVVANISALVLKRMRDEVSRLAKPGTIAILSGVLDRDVADVIAAYQDADWSHVSTLTEGDWTATTLRRPSTG